MKTQVNRSTPPLMWITGMAIIMFCGIGSAAFMGWLPNAAASPRQVTCIDCGVTAPANVSDATEHSPSENVPESLYCTPIRSVVHTPQGASGTGQPWPIRSVAWESNQIVGNDIAVRF